MIKTENGHFSYHGDPMILMTDCSIILNEIYSLFKEYYGEKEACDMIEQCVKLAKMTDEQLNEYYKDSLFKFMEKLYK